MRSFLAVLAGMALWSVLWLSSNTGLTAAMPGSFRPDGSTDSVGLLLMTLTLSVVFSVVAGFTTATLARQNPMGHVVVLAAIQLCVGISMQIQYWSSVPVWYHLTFLLLLAPGHLLGGSLCVQRRVRATAT